MHCHNFTFTFCLCRSRLGPAIVKYSVIRCSIGMASLSSELGYVQVSGTLSMLESICNLDFSYQWFPLEPCALLI